MKYDLVGLGNALLDLQIETPATLLEVLEVTKGSMTLVEAKHQADTLSRLEQVLSTHDVKKTSGGCSANTLVGFASYGGRACFFGRVGKDEQGQHYANDMKAIGLDAQLSEDATKPTGTCLALITPDAERTMLTHLGAAVELRSQDLNAEIIAEAKVTYIEGYLWDSLTARKASLDAIRIAKTNQRQTAFTFSDSFCVDRHRADFVELAKNQIDILFCNETEAMSATQTKSAEEAFRILKEWSPFVFMTWGEKGALLSDRERGLYEHVPTWPVRVVDKLGAGDLFAAGALFGWIQNRSLQEIGRLGCFSAGKVIEQFGARLPFKLSTHIDEAIRGPKTAA